MEGRCFLQLIQQDGEKRTYMKIKETRELFFNLYSHSVRTRENNTSIADRDTMDKRDRDKKKRMRKKLKTRYGGREFKRSVSKKSCRRNLHGKLRHTGAS